jgi:hypothetical protein
MLPAGSADILKQAVEALGSIAQESLAPLFKSITDRLEQSLLKMHQEDFDAEISSTTNCSKVLFVTLPYCVFRLCVTKCHLVSQDCSSAITHTWDSSPVKCLLCVGIY